MASMHSLLYRNGNGNAKEDADRANERNEKSRTRMLKMRIDKMSEIDINYQKQFN